MENKNNDIEKEKPSKGKFIFNCIIIILIYVGFYLFMNSSIVKNFDRSIENGTILDNIAEITNKERNNIKFNINKVIFTNEYVLRELGFNINGNSLVLAIEINILNKGKHAFNINNIGVELSDENGATYQGFFQKNYLDVTDEIINPEMNKDMFLFFKIPKKQKYILRLQDGSILSDVVTIEIIDNQIYTTVKKEQKEIEDTHQITKTSLDKENKNSFIKEPQSPQEILADIDRLQAKYFEIIMRHDMLWQVTDDYNGRENDLEDLSILYKEINKKTDKTHPLYKKFKKIVSEDSNESVKDTIELTAIADQYEKNIDDLLNEVYKEIKLKLPEKDFIALRNSQRKWIKDLNAYTQIYDQQDFGSISPLVKYYYEADMKCYRTQLLMMYL